MTTSFWRAADLVTEESASLPDAGPVSLRLTCDGEEYRFIAESDGGVVLEGAGAAKLLGAEVAPGFGSVRLGLFAVGQRGDATFTRPPAVRPGRSRRRS